MFRRVSFLKAALWSAAALLLATVITSSQTSAQVSSSQCCTPAQSTIETSGTTGWIVQPSSGTAVPAVAIAPFMSWHAALGSSQWIANVGNAGHHNQPVNDYTYVYRGAQRAHLPKGLRRKPLTIHACRVLWDNQGSKRICPFIWSVSPRGCLFVPTSDPRIAAGERLHFWLEYAEDRRTQRWGRNGARRRGVGRRIFYDVPHQTHADPHPPLQPSRSPTAA